MLINNDGGGIFSFLPVATQADAFEQHVATPHGLDFAHAAALYGAAHVPVSDPAQLRAALDDLAARRPDHDHRDADRSGRQPGSAPPDRRPGAGRPRVVSRGDASQPVSAGSITPSLSSDSASSAAGSESATIPQPA